MIRQKANSVSRRALLGIAIAAFSLFLMDGALVSANRGEGVAPVGLLQTVQSSATVALESSVQFVYDMQAVYKLTHLDDFVPAAGEGKLQNERLGRLYLCSETKPTAAPAKSVI